jgi:hypothetical protein
MIKFFCLGKLPIIVSTPDGDIKVTSSPTFKSNVKLNSLPIDIKSLSKVLLPLNLLFFDNI